MSESGLSGRGRKFFVLVEALRAFKAGPLSDYPSNRALADAAGVSPTTIGDWLRGERFPQDIGKVLVVVGMVRKEAAARRVATSSSGSAGLLDEGRWRAAYWEEARRRAGVISDEVEHAQAVAVLAGRRVRVGDADPRLLGVHATISVSGVPDEVLPEYVPRDVDAAEFGVWAKVKEAAQRGGFVLLVGGSSVGKTRCAAEAVKTLLPDWWLVHPAGPTEVTALAQAPPPRTVVWLDELQRYLDGEHGLTGAVARALLTAAHPVVIIGTLWPDRYTAYTALPARGGADPHTRERQVLDLALVIRIDSEFSPAEQDRARAAAAHDPRLTIALETAGYGLTQTLAAAPQLVARWQDARTADPYAWAVLTAALDVARLGARAPLGPDLLRAAAPGYCTSVQQAEAPDNWFEQALAYATEKLHGAAAALSPVGADMGRLAGYIVADYLIQHASRERHYARVPASTWDAVLSKVHDPADVGRLGDSASNRLLYRYAIPLYCHAADVGGLFDAFWLAELLAERGDLDGLRTRADAGDDVAAERLAELLAEHGDLDGAAQVLAALADTGDRNAARELAELLAEHGDLDGLRTRADAGDSEAAYKLAELLAERGDLDGLGARADAGDGYAAQKLAELLAELLTERGDLDGLRGRADVGDDVAAERLAELLAEHGDLDGAAQVLAALADTGDRNAARELAGLLAEHGDLDGLRGRADAGDSEAAYKLAGLLAERGDLDGLHTRANAGDSEAAFQMARLLAEHGDLDGAAHVLRAQADAGDGYAAQKLARLLAEHGDLDGAAHVLRARADAGEGTPPRSWPGCWLSAATWTGYAAGPTQGIATPPRSWPGCWLNAATWTGYAAGPTPATGMPPRSWPGCWLNAATWTGYAAGPTQGIATPPISWPGCWLNAATWTGCAPEPRSAMGMPPGSWPDY